MRAPLVCAVVALASCKKESPAGTVVKDWSYASWSDAGADIDSLAPPKTVSQEVEWPVAEGPPVQLHVETEIGQGAIAGTRWHTPRHLHITLAKPTTVAIPNLDCMPGPGTKLGADGATSIGFVGCFIRAKEPSNFVFEIDGDGRVTRTTAGKP